MKFVSNIQTEINLYDKLFQDDISYVKISYRYGQLFDNTKRWLLHSKVYFVITNRKETLYEILKSLVNDSLWRCIFFVLQCLVSLGGFMI